MPTIRIKSYQLNKIHDDPQGRCLYKLPSSTQVNRWVPPIYGALLEVTTNLVFSTGFNALWSSNYFVSYLIKNLKRTKEKAEKDIFGRRDERRCPCFT